MNLLNRQKKGPGFEGPTRALDEKKFQSFSEEADLGMGLEIGMF